MKINPKLYHIALIVYCLIIFILSSLPGEDFPKVDFEFSDKIVHLFIYSILYVLFFYSLKNQSKYTNLQKYSAGYAVLFTALYGITDELHQYFVPNRSCDFYDWLADLTGAVIMYLVFKFIINRRKSIIAASLLFLILNGCSGTENSKNTSGAKITLEATEAWQDFMPMAGDNSDKRFGFLIKLKIDGKDLDTNYTVSDFVINFNNDIATGKKLAIQFENISANSIGMNIVQDNGVKYLDNNKENPLEASFSFTINRKNKAIKTFNTPKIKIQKVQ